MAGLIKIFSDTLQDDPFGRKGSVRLIQAALVRGYKRAQNYVIENKNSGRTSGHYVRHGTHPMSLAAILEAGGPKGSRKSGEHEFTTPGLYTCPDSAVSPFEYATRARIIMDHDCVNYEYGDFTKQPCTQFVFRGEELVDGQLTKKVKSFGADHQWIYKEDYHVNWTELQVWIGIPVFTQVEAGIYCCAPCFDGARRCTRLRRAEKWNPAGLSSTKYKDVSPTATTPFPVISSEASAATMPPEGW